MTQDRDPRRPDPKEALRLQAEEQRLAAAQRNATLVKIINGIYYLAGALEILLLLRVVLRLSGANPENQFASVIYGLSNPFVAPFANLFSTPVLDTAHLFDVNALVAIGVYALLAWLVARLIWIVGSQ